MRFLRNTHTHSHTHTHNLSVFHSLVIISKMIRSRHDMNMLSRQAHSLFPLLHSHTLTHTHSLVNTQICWAHQDSMCFPEGVTANIKTHTHTRTHTHVQGQKTHSHTLCDALREKGRWEINKDRQSRIQLVLPVGVCRSVSGVQVYVKKQARWAE